MTPRTESDLPPTPPLRATAVARAVARWGVVFLAVAVFSVLAAELQMREEVWFDTPVLAALHGLRSETTTALMRRITWLGNGEVLAVIAVVVSLGLWLRRHPYSALFVAAGAAGAGLLNYALKVAFARERPDLLLRLSSADGFAFPSGHSMASAAIYGALAIVAFTRFPKLRWPAVVSCIALVSAIGVSRAYLHVHFPSDVVAGWAIGLLWPFALKPLVMGHGFRRETIAADELEADGVVRES